jgi:hypothetical protein
MHNKKISDGSSFVDNFKTIKAVYTMVKQKEYYILTKKSG